MPRIDRKLPPRRADYSFGDLVYWHLFVYGTRQKGDPSAKMGRVWEPYSICELLGITTRTLRNWIADKHLPDSTVDLERQLFGDNPLFDDWRLELAEALRRTRSGKRANRSRLGRWLADHALPMLPSNRALVRIEHTETVPGPDSPDFSGNEGKSIPGENAREPEKPATAAISRADRPAIGKSPEKETAETVDGNLPSTIPSGRIQKPTPPPASQRKRRRSLLPAILFPDWRWSREDRQEGQSRQAPGWQDNDREENHGAGRTGGLDADRPSGPAPSHPGRKIAALIATAGAVLLGMYAWSIRPIELKGSASTPAGSAAGPVSPKPETGQLAKTTPEPVPPPRTEEQRRAEEERRVMEKTIAAMKAAHDREMREREEEARRLDREGAAGAAARAQRDREWNAKQVAGMGYRLLEYTGVTGASIGHVQTETVYDCALSCLADKCDAFAWYRDERPVGPRTCTLYRAPFTLEENTGYTAGKKLSDVLRGVKLTAAGGTAQAVRLLAQASPSPTEPDAGGVTHCPTGPVKVTGFALSCDTMLAGGTTLGSNRLSWTVTNINECARKCQPIKNCVGFTYNAAQQGGHSCVLFGPTPEKREAKGWVSGERPLR